MKVFKTLSAAICSLFQGAGTKLLGFFQRKKAPGITGKNVNIQSEYEEETPDGFKRKKKTSIQGSNIHIDPDEARMIT